ncbi:hypothetical protein [Brevibacillus dissolubilis]|uniref:hypothetical protein n=1 Tax=Brevibacillus dissolubilis TaxID=1844116 RepID=UPI0011175D0B|nr:hypothetical protein [Brevibacillus dissolubilis]
MKKFLLSTLALLLISLGVLPAQAATEPVMTPKKLAIYYGWPSLVNDATTLQQAKDTFGQFDVIVFGDTIEDTSHGDHANTQEIIADLNTKGKKVFGYVDLGVSTQNLTYEQLQAKVDAWDAMGVYGIFFDDAGYDYLVTRARQNTMVDYAHAAGLKVFMNAWRIDDVLADVDETGAAVPTKVGAGDWYLAESWLIAGGKYTSVSSWATKADKALAYHRSKGVEIAVVSTNVSRGATPTDSTTDPFKMAWWAAAMYGFPFQWTDYSYSSGNNQLHVYADPSNSYGTTFTGDPSHLNNATVNERMTDKGKIRVNGDGSTTGTGGFEVVTLPPGYPTITVNGDASDWSSVQAAATGTTTVTTLKAANNATNLYLLVQGTSLNVKGQFYLDTDNNNATGYLASYWTAGGADYLIENSSLYKYTGANNSWSWQFVTSLPTSQYVKNATTVEASLPLTTLGITKGSTIRLGYIKADSRTERLPASNVGLPAVTLLP